ncbi:hypothetical protein [Streptomyces sp. NPDC058612]|uniref:hypothetical protein n=1 Tax=Streptomyces sp. NPDC058612 TaxID=3346555 RepID=UPI0036620DE0
MMPKKVETGSTAIDLLAYLFGPGERDEHTDPHLVAGWDPGPPCPARDPGRMSLADLALLLDAPVEALRGPKPEERVWHVSVRNAPGARLLSDAEWAEVAAAMVHAAGIAEHGDERPAGGSRCGTRTTTSTSRRPSPARTAGTPAYAATSSTCTPPPGPSKPAGASPRCPRSTGPRADGRYTGEAEKAARRGLAETARESLQRTVHTAAALAHGDTDPGCRLSGLDSAEIRAKGAMS